MTHIKQHRQQSHHAQSSLEQAVEHPPRHPLQRPWLRTLKPLPHSARRHPLSLFSPCYKSYHHFIGLDDIHLSYRQSTKMFIPFLKFEEFGSGGAPAKVPEHRGRQWCLVGLLQDWTGCRRDFYLCGRYYCHRPFSYMDSGLNYLQYPPQTWPLLHCAVLFS